MKPYLYLEQRLRQMANLSACPAQAGDPDSSWENRQLTVFDDASSSTSACSLSYYLTP